MELHTPYAPSTTNLITGMNSSYVKYQGYIYIHTSANTMVTLRHVHNNATTCVINTPRWYNEPFYCLFGEESIYVLIWNGSLSLSHTLTHRHIDTVTLQTWLPHTTSALSSTNKNFILANLVHWKLTKRCTAMSSKLRFTNKNTDTKSKPDKTSSMWTTITNPSLPAVFHFICSWSQFLRVSRFLWNQRTFFCTLSRATWVALSWDDCSLMDSKKDCTWGSNTHEFRNMHTGFIVFVSVKIFYRFYSKQIDISLFHHQNMFWYCQYWLISTSPCGIMIIRC